MLKKFIVLIVMVFLINIELTTFSATDLTVDINIDYAADVVTISGIVSGFGDWVTLYVEGPENRLEYIGSADVVNDRYEIRIRLTNPVPNGIYRITVKAEGMTEPNQEWFEYSPAVVTPPTVELAEITVDCVIGKTYDVIISAENISDGSKAITLNYDAGKLQVININQVGTGVTAESHDDVAGVIQFVLNREIADGSALSGVLNVVKFKGIGSGQAVISVEG